MAKPVHTTKTSGTTQPKFAQKYINVFLGIGSNVGDRAANLRTAYNHIHRLIGKVAKFSHIYETEPWGNEEQEAFLNQVIMINTTMDPRELLEAATKIEREMGRVRKEKWGPRIIDIDILFYGKRIIRDKGLEIPHPELHKRAFVLVPLLEIAPDLMHPVLKKPIDELYMACEDTSDVVMLS
ncbi:MAG: 2-amino-4-hydroxy-6-hydroxymethyldihydropteridine diphosphokinase [Lewinellaceae bacterium]|nr:2-amino-4-hydroxy-6-hydroxymethyldihydropteridine diphosphokinase [Lewinellaceae bacterium]